MRSNRRLFLRGFAWAAVVATTGTLVVRAQPAPKVIAVKAHRFTYEPELIVLKLNEPVILQLTSLDVVMGFSVPDFATRATIIPGQVTEVRLTPNKTGDFTFLCDVFCGDGHENMNGTIRVVA